VTLPEETLKALESLVYADVEDLVALHGEDSRNSILTTKVTLMEWETAHLEWLKPVLSVVWNQGLRTAVGGHPSVVYEAITEVNPYEEAK